MFTAKDSHPGSGMGGHCVLQVAANLRYAMRCYSHNTVFICQTEMDRKCSKDVKSFVVGSKKDQVYVFFLTS